VKVETWKEEEEEGPMVAKAQSRIGARKGSFRGSEFHVLYL